MIAGVRRTIVENDWGVLGVLLVFFAGAVVGSRAGGSTPTRPARSLLSLPKGAGAQPPSPFKGEGNPSKARMGGGGDCRSG